MTDETGSGTPSGGQRPSIVRRNKSGGDMTCRPGCIESSYSTQQCLITTVALPAAESSTTRIYTPRRALSLATRLWTVPVTGVRQRTPMAARARRHSIAMDEKYIYMREVYLYAWRGANGAQRRNALLGEGKRPKSRDTSLLKGWGHCLLSLRPGVIDGATSQPGKPINGLGMQKRRQSKVCSIHTLPVLAAQDNKRHGDIIAARYTNRAA